MRSQGGHAPVALVSEHAALAAAVAADGDVPSVYACYCLHRQAARDADALTHCIDRVTAGPRQRIPELGRNVAINASDMPAYARRAALPVQERAGARALQRPDATWGQVLQQLPVSKGHRMNNVVRNYS